MNEQGMFQAWTGKSTWYAEYARRSSMAVARISEGVWEYGLCQTRRMGLWYSWCMWLMKLAQKGQENGQRRNKM